MKDKLNLCLALGFLTILSTANFACADSEDLVQIPGALRVLDNDPVVLGGRTFGDDTSIGDLVELLGGRIRKVTRGDKRTYITIEINNKHLHAFGAVNLPKGPDIDALRTTHNKAETLALTSGSSTSSESCCPDGYSSFYYGELNGIHYYFCSNESGDTLTCQR